MAPEFINSSDDEDTEGQAAQLSIASFKSERGTAMWAYNGKATINGACVYTYEH
jgi:hypothetical protein